CIQALELPFTF
nr:immunoglobulin light chain junction region [Macaca mulatta]